ncbi:hypothetical protein AOL_s00091g65 [Orbilia oligospora ATCC 24927]|uniref:ubiquitinyl hydrolase 1 n=1 Tax=Arthrobotrys oligospora (strain ATCC 24927 / CBS 115.81 / DSM 1491) TaxID=756982 RepID=G1XI13_ARTOA|nr:hypothetical protein AOL_s00091g65 [Orbilia oligospora ATCC 24927]EGX47244.1 hypothetical protein AOL_s00091g65 [Orbilia oligospora ATCC 24927]
MEMYMKGNENYHGIGKGEIEYMIHHIILPPNVPRAEVEEQRPKHHLLLKFLLQIAEKYIPSSDTSDLCVPGYIQNILNPMTEIHDPREDFPKAIQNALIHLASGDAFALHVLMQNAGIIFRRVDGTLQFEVFEASADAEAVVTCQGRLKCTYPGPATCIPWDVVSDPGFLKELAAFLHHMDTYEFTARTRKKSHKGGNRLSETRETVDPCYIIELLTGIMRGIGKEIGVGRVTKNVRDEVNSGSAKNPWRRSGLWLVTRVALQTTLSARDYKCFLLEVVRVILQQAVQFDLDSFTVSCISKKLARRAQKLGENQISSLLLENIMRTSEVASRLISRRWETAIAASQRQVTWNSQLGTSSNISVNTQLRLPTGSKWIKKRIEVFENPPKLRGVIKDPSEVVCHLYGKHFPTMITGTESETAISIIDFENWVKVHLQDWCNSNSEADIVEILARTIQTYHVKARGIYLNSNVLDTSLMMLTILEMWVQLDEALCRMESLMRQYSPELPLNILEPLLVIQQSDMARVRKVERYLAKRYEALPPCHRTSIFNPNASETTFEYQYYQNSFTLQNLRYEIIRKAEVERLEKQRELDTLNAKYEYLRAEYRRLQCECCYSWNGAMCCGTLICRKCALKRKAESLTIVVHEWPLPESESEMRSTLFELQPLKEFVIWRDTTYYILTDVCSTTGSFTSDPKNWGLENWESLAAHKSAIQTQISWFSTRTPLCGASHYTDRKIPALESDVLLKHAGVYRLFDKRRAEWVASRHKAGSFVSACQSTVSDTAYSRLLYGINDVTHTHNEVIAAQDQCPAEISLREFEAFGSLRSGRNLQWHNILLELRKDDLSFKKDAVYTLIMHAACQVGVATDPDDWRRDAHITLADYNFSRELLQTLRHFLSVIRDNWEQANTLKVLVLLARKLASCGHSNFRSEAIKYLREARKVCHPWIQSLQKKLELAAEDSVVLNFRHWLLRVSGIQCSTFDVDDQLLPVAFETQKDVVELLICRNIIYDNSLGTFYHLPPDLRFLQERNRRFAVISEHYVQSSIRANHGILFAAIREILPSHNQVSGIWEQINSSADRWWRLVSDVEGTVTVIHLDILQGRLLVNGKPNGRLPADYYEHPSYRKLLGAVRKFRRGPTCLIIINILQRIFDVIESSRPGMSYQTKSLFSGITLHFHLDGLNLIIQKDDGDIHEFIPSEKFLGDVPRPIIEIGSQWLNLKKNKVIFYQGPEWWRACPSPDDWILLQRIRGAWVMKRQNAELLDIYGDIHAASYEALGTIEATDYMIATVDESLSISIDIPRYKLKFWINEKGNIECRTLRGWVVDENQEIGTFIGLNSFVKLRTDDERCRKESILVPFGRVETTIPDPRHHALIKIHPGESDREFTIFSVDKVLNRLLDDGSLRARYTRLYLHALSSGLQEDPLTGRCGTEEALDGLRSAASFSFQILHDNEAHILGKIAELAPSRYFYPSHLKVMQDIKWEESVPIWVQDDTFYPAVKEIFHDWSRRQFLIEGSTLHKPPTRGSEALTERARNHRSIFEPGDPLADARASASKVHQLRHGLSEVEAYTQDMARASFQWHQKQDLDSDLHKFFESKRDLPGFNKKISLNYCPEWSYRDPVTEWCTLYELCRVATKAHRFAVLFTFSALVYQVHENRKYLKSLLAIAVNSGFNQPKLPSYPSFKPAIGTSPNISDIREFFDSSVVSYDVSDYVYLLQQRGKDDKDYGVRRRKQFISDSEAQVNLAAQAVMRQWPRAFATPPTGPYYNFIEMSRAIEKISPWFEICYRNREFFQLLDDISSTLRTWRSEVNMVQIFDSSVLAGHRISSASQPAGERSRGAHSLQDLLADRSPPRHLYMQKTLPYSLTRNTREEERNLEVKSLNIIMRQLRNSQEPFARQYTQDLRESTAALRQYLGPQSLLDVRVEAEELPRYRQASISNVENIFSQVASALSPQSELQRLLRTAGLWPSITKLRVLQNLRLKERKRISTAWRKTIIELGETITWQQRANRLLRLSQDGLAQELQKELWNAGRQNWKAEDYTDWLLLEIDSEMLIRPVQAGIGMAMMNDAKDGNAVMQLNMGEGKSAVIVPAVVAALADTQRFVRSIVLKPLSTQMFRILVQRLSGLCDRRIYFLPLSRGLSLTLDGVDRIRSLYKDCMSHGSILLALPEHLLSFKLMGLEKLIQGDTALSQPLITTQKWLDENTRDVLDESDEILHIRYQLIYTMGAQQTLEGGRERWAIIQEVLDLLREKVIEWAKEDPMAVEVVLAEGVKYPSIRIIDKDKGEHFIKEMAKDICINDTDKVPSISLRLKLLNTETRELARKFIAVQDIPLEEQQTLFSSCEHLKTQLLVLRGLIADGVLLFVLQEKRYRVDYGLDTKRSNLAVPYRAKDRPAVKAEFGHPEVVLTLTCLTYYYTGLDDSNLQSCFNLLLKTDDPDLVYENWTKRHSDVPASLSKLRGLNLLDQDQVNKEILPFFKYNKDAIDFFLAELIFPREAKGFPYKLSTSGWDIAQRKGHNTTGFSGTNDNRYLLPTSIKQLDLAQQLHTNSLVLTNILRDENSAVIKVHRNGVKLQANEMLALVVGLTPKVQVLLDVGAQILELTNEEVARQWLDCEPSSNILGTVFFGGDDELRVTRRDGKVESFLSSSLSKQLDRVLVYLDEAHTRGTDLKLPIGARAAVTLGPNLAKDKFVQGCMRMRKLGQGHSLTFLASPDIYAHIQKAVVDTIQKDVDKPPNEVITTSDVLLWTMLESCRQIQHGFAIWADQGSHYLKRKDGWYDFQINGDHSKLKEATMEVETRSLVEMYAVQEEKRRVDVRIACCRDSHTIQARLHKFAVSRSSAAGVQEEQEREVDREMEEETNIERPPPANAREHYLHPDVVDLVTLGEFRSSSSAFALAFNIFEHTSSRGLLEINAWNSNLFVTQDFARTVERGCTDDMDDYLRPVRWIISLRHHPYLILISPYEANKLMKSFRNSPVCRLHCYTPKVSRTMQAFDQLIFCPVPGTSSFPNAPVDLKNRFLLNIFAGQLFFEDIRYYRALCELLGIYYGKVQADVDIKRENDGWINQFARESLGLRVDRPIIVFSRSPVPFLREITKMRRKGQGFASTHLGCLLSARVLQENDFTLLPSSIHDHEKNSSARPIPS